jgi:hypothetical protein
VVEDYHIGAGGLRQRRQFLHLALPDERGGFGGGTGLRYALQRDGAGACGQFGEFFERLLDGSVRGAVGRSPRLPLDADQDGALPRSVASRVLCLRRFRGR